MDVGGEGRGRGRAWAVARRHSDVQPRVATRVGAVIEVPDEAFAAVVGAFFAPDPDLFAVLLDATADPPGDLAELGVLFGKSAIVVGAHQQPGETFTVVDLFGRPAPDEANRHENESSYPGFEREAFDRAYLSCLPTLPVVVEGPTPAILERASAGTHRFVHVDASHLFDHVVTDLEIARTLLRPDGIVVLDDFRTDHAPGVAAAAWQEVTRTGLKPFLLSPAKMYATWGDPTPWRTAVERWLPGRDLLAEHQRINDLTVLRVSLPYAPPASRHPAKRYVPEVAWPALASARRLLGRARSQ